MTLALYLHPLASFCHKVLIALYENGTSFEARQVDLMDGAEHARHLQLWPVGKIPVLRDEARNKTLPETTIIIEYLEQHYPGSKPLLPRDPAELLEARLWDRFYDNYVQVPMSKIVTDRLRASGENDARGVADAHELLTTSYGMIDKHMQGRTWGLGDSFSIVDCAAAPGLFYADTLQTFSKTYPHLTAYFERLMLRPSIQRVIKEAQPFFQYYPYQEKIPARFLG